jgi:hypothetical protein
MNEQVNAQDADVVWEQIQGEVDAAWSSIFRVVNTVVDHHVQFGFKLIESKINPSFQDILLSLKMMEALLDVFPVDDVEYATSRMILNAKQQINNIELVVTALKHNRQDDYEAAMARLRTQAQF